MADNTSKADCALQTVGLVLSDEETHRIAESYRTLRDKADALASLELHDEAPIDLVQLTGSR